MTERQAPYKTATPVAMELPEEFLNRAMALQEQAPGGGCLWLARGNFVAEFANGAQNGLKMILYQKAADIWAVGISTVREDLRNAAELGDWVDEMNFQVAREHCRCARTEARIKETDPLSVLQQRANESDKYSGQLCPPRVWKAQIKSMRDGNKSDDGEDVLSRLRGASSALATAIKRANGKKRWVKLMPDLMTVSASVEDLLEKAEGL